MSYTDFDFPHTSLYTNDLRELIANMRRLEGIVKTFVDTEQIKFADPIIWNITAQYAKSTVVLNTAGNAYLSKQAVPAGIQLNNEEYWQEIFNFTDYTRTANKNLTVNYEANTTRATADYSVDDWLIWNDVLYKVTSDITIDDAFIVSPEVGYNIVHFTIEDFIKAFVTYATNLINQYKDDIDASELAYRQQLAQDISDTTATLQAQLNTAISGATVNSEVINARVGLNNIQYDTLRDAIINQYKDNHNNLLQALETNNVIVGINFNNGYLSSDGASINSSSGFVTTDYIEVTAGTWYLSKALRYAYYDASRNPLSVLNPAAPYTDNHLNLGSNVKYIRITISISDVGILVLVPNNEGTITWNLKASNVLNETLDNLYSLESHFNEALISNNMMNYNSYSSGYLSSDGSSINTDPASVTTDYIEVSAGKWYISKTLRYALYDSSKNPLSVGNPYPPYTDNVLTLGSNVKYIRATIGVSDADSLVIKRGDSGAETWSLKSEPHKIYVGKESWCDFAEVQSAIDVINDDSATNRYIIYLLPGTYSKFTMKITPERVRYISLIGLSNYKDTIIYDDKGTYESSPAEIFNTGVIKNISFINETTPSSKVPGVLHDYAFAMHIGALADGNGNMDLEINNCYAFSNAGPALGCGTKQDDSIIIKHSSFVSGDDSGTNTLKTNGAFYLHTNGSQATSNQTLHMENCSCKSNCHVHGGSIQQRTSYSSPLIFYIRNSIFIGTSGPNIELQLSNDPIYGSFNNLPNSLNNI